MIFVILHTLHLTSTTSQTPANSKVENHQETYRKLEKCCHALALAKFKVALLLCLFPAVLTVCHLSQQESVETPGPPKPHLLSGCLWRKRPKTGPVENSLLPPVDTQNYCSISHASCGRTELDHEQAEEEEAEDNERDQQPPVRRSCEVKELSNGRTHTALKPLPRSRSNQSRFRSMHAREKKATQMLAIVLGE